MKKLRPRLSLALACSFVALASSAYAADRACSVDAVAANGTKVHFEYYMADGQRRSLLKWILPASSSPLAVSVEYTDVTDHDIGPVWAINVDGIIYLSSETSSNQANLIISRDGRGFQEKVFFKKGPAYNSNFGMILVHSTNYGHWPTGQFLVEAISAGAPVVVTVRGDAGDVFSRATYDFGTTSQRDALISQVRQKLARAVSDGCQPDVLMDIAPPPKQ